ncbi:polymeric immunoglobulin receptor-like [Mastacembelus armatus]|uniref:polymeric immunoglobulin receptor-like n=1 Tax=Mastacembelus armatus TaxID=205130 RepID=UPI000E45409E|nr:polymeric immunoglobulin receptor-like [Mastacembelus armatus]
MAFPYILHLILAGFMGIHCEITVSKLSVTASGSITIPCLYNESYRNNVKYLCKGYYFNTCKTVVRTDEPTRRSGRFSVYDNRNQNIFAVSINDLTDKDKHYWCAMEIKYAKDVSQHFELSVTTGLPSLYVDQQEITVFEGGSVTVGCHYKYPTAPKWCRLGSTCVADESGSMEITPETINTHNPVLNVTMSAIKPEHSGWYLCAQDDLQMPVHITVKELTSTRITTSNNTAGKILTT